MYKVVPRKRKSEKKEVSRFPFKVDIHRLIFLSLLSLWPVDDFEWSATRLTTHLSQSHLMGDLLRLWQLGAHHNEFTVREGHWRRVTTNECPTSHSDWTACRSDQSIESLWGHSFPALRSYYFYLHLAGHIREREEVKGTYCPANVKEIRA